MDFSIPPPSLVSSSSTPPFVTSPNNLDPTLPMTTQCPVPAMAPECQVYVFSPSVQKIFGNFSSCSCSLGRAILLLPGVSPLQSHSRRRPNVVPASEQQRCSRSEHRFTWFSYQCRSSSRLHHRSEWQLRIGVVQSRSGDAGYSPLSDPSCARISTAAAAASALHDPARSGHLLAVARNGIADISIVPAHDTDVNADPDILSVPQSTRVHSGSGSGTLRDARNSHHSDHTIVASGLRDCTR